MDEAIDSYAHALHVQPRYPDALRNLGLCLRFDDATKCSRRALELRPGAAASWLCPGTVHKRRGDIRAAIPCYEKALSLRPDYAETHHTLGICLRTDRRPAARPAHVLR